MINITIIINSNNTRHNIFGLWSIDLLERLEKDLDNGQTVTADLVKDIIQQEIAAIEEDMGTDLFNTFPFDQARKVFEEVALADEFVDFLTLPAYEIIN